MVWGARSRRSTTRRRPARVITATTALLAAAALTTTGLGSASAAEVDTWGTFTVSPSAPFTGAVAMPGNFPATTFTSTSSAATVVSGASTWQAASTPVGVVYGSSRDRTYLNQRPAANNAASPGVTTYTFASPTPSAGWAFALGDIDADEVTISATAADGAQIPVAGLGYQESYNSCHRTGGPSCDAANLNDRPSWTDGGTTGLLLGNARAADTDGATAWFEPTVPIVSLTMSYRWRSGFPIYQTWFVAKTFAAGGTVTLDDTPLAGATVTVFDDAGAVVGTAVSGASGAWSLPSLVATGPYRAVVSPPPGIAPLPDRTFSLTESDAAGIDFPFVTPPPPIAEVDAASTLQGIAVSHPLLGNDLPGSEAFPLVADSVRFAVPPGAPSGTVLSDDGRQLTVPGEGTWSVDADGVALFAPEPAFTGTTTAIPYSVADSRGGLATAAVAVEVTAVTPLAADDPRATPAGLPQRFEPLFNDLAGDPSVPLVPATLVFVLPPDAPPGSELGPDGRTLVIAGEGSYAIGEDAWVTFAPDPTFTGVATTVPYAVADVNGTIATANIIVTVSPAEEAVGTIDEIFTPQGTPVSGPLTTNDAPSTATATFLPESIRFALPLSPPPGSSLSDDGRTLVIGGEGTYTLEPGADLATFTPDPAFVGTATPAPYSVLDTEGRTASATIIVHVTPVTPSAGPDASTTDQGATLVVQPLANDAPGTAAVPLRADTVALQLPADAPAGSSLSPDGVLTIAGEGTYTVAATGEVEFAPIPSFTGPATPVPYTVADANGTVATSVISITVTPVVPIPSPDAAITPHATGISVDVLGNDLPGAAAVALDPTSVRLDVPAEAPAGTTLGADGRSLVVPGEGEYTVDAVTGVIGFVPVPTFVGEATPVPYTVTDANGTSAGAVLTISVTPVTPVAGVDNVTAPHGEPIVIDVLANDVSGNEADGGAPAPLVPGSVRLEVPGGIDPGALSEDGRTLSLDGIGTFVVDAVSGTVTFTPAEAFSGLTPVVPYTVLDANGTLARSSILVEVAPAPVDPPTEPPVEPPVEPGGPGSPAAPAAPAAPAGPTTGATGLPATGTSALAALPAALMLLVGGVLAVAARRVRSSAPVPSRRH
ncbi:carboxypeptidase regulatory-like domain-containing protein [Agromyces sp. PvR057]|uniref:Ig-like domain-containing protein n=1 Tax=Agromyces sp. PvR057 TaxID=3156403 RepID=UPI00339A39D2